MRTPSIEKPFTALHRQERIRPHLARKLITVMAGSSSRLGRIAVIGWSKEMHREKGNLCFANAHVAAFINGAVASVVRIPAGVTNRLAVP